RLRRGDERPAAAAIVARVLRRFLEAGGPDMMEAFADNLARRIGASIERPPVPAAIQAEADAMWRDCLATQDLAAVRESFFAADELVVIEDLVPAALCAR